MSLTRRRLRLLRRLRGEREHQTAAAFFERESHPDTASEKVYLRRVGPGERRPACSRARRIGANAIRSAKSSGLLSNARDGRARQRKEIRLYTGRPRRRAPRIAVCAAALCALVAAPAAQQTREESIAAQQAEKATRLKPYEPTAAERALQRIRDALATPPTGYVWLGTVYPGGLFGAGPGLRLRYGGTGTFDLHGGVTIKNYKVAATRLRLPARTHRPVRLDVHASRIDAPDVAFYGIGSETASSERTSYVFRPSTVGVGVQARPGRWISVGGDVDYLKIESRVKDVSAPAARRLLATTGRSELDTAHLRGHAFGMFDSRESPGYTRSGGMYRVDAWIYRQRDGDLYSFERIDGEASQFFPILRANWVIALNALASVTTTGAHQRVPYFLLPDLGGASELRGYPSLRFRDRNRLLLTAEYRWTPSRFVDMALFYSAGKVAAEARDLDLRALRRSAGGGIRIHTPTATVLRIELARTREGTGLIFAFSPIF